MPAFQPDADQYVSPDTTLQNLIVSKSLLVDEATAKRRKSFAGKYMNLDWTDTAEFIFLSGELNYIYQSFRTTLTEVEPGLFFSRYGDAVDFRSRPPTFGSIPLINVDERTRNLQIAFYALCDLVFVSALLFGPSRALISRIRQKKVSVDAGAVQAPRSSRLVWSGILVMLASLLSLLFPILIALIPNMVYFLASLPLWSPYVDLLWWQFAFLSLPYVSLVFAVVIMLMTGLRLSVQSETRAIRVYHLIVTVALLSFNLAILL